MDRKVAFVTGASRGIGRATSLALAREGYDVVVTARTVTEGTGRKAAIDLPGSIETTAQEVRKLGREALPIRLDLLDVPSLDRAVEQTLAEWGRIDVLVNNGIYQGPGSQDPIEALTQEMLQKTFQGNLFSQVHLIQRVLPAMLAQGGGVIINVISGSGLTDPPAAFGKGGWGFAYAASKAAFNRLAGVLKVEYPDHGLRVYNLEPGFVITDEIRAKGTADQWKDNLGSAPPEVPAGVMAWLATHPDEAERWHGRVLFAQKFAADRDTKS